MAEVDSCVQCEALTEIIVGLGMRDADVQATVVDEIATLLHDLPKANPIALAWRILEIVRPRLREEVQNTVFEDLAKLLQRQRDQTDKALDSLQAMREEVSDLRRRLASSESANGRLLNENEYLRQKAQSVPVKGFSARGLILDEAADYAPPRKKPKPDHPPEGQVRRGKFGLPLGDKPRERRDIGGGYTEVR